MHTNNLRFVSCILRYFTMRMNVNRCWGWTTIRLFFRPPCFQPSQLWVQIVVMMLFCSMLEINDTVLYWHANMKAHIFIFSKAKEFQWKCSNVIPMFGHLFNF